MIYSGDQHFFFNLEVITQNKTGRQDTELLLKTTLKLISKLFESVKQLPQCVIYTLRHPPPNPKCVVSGRGVSELGRALLKGLRCSGSCA